MHRAYSLITVKAFDDDQRVIRGIATTPTPDRIGDIVEPLGVKFKNPLPLLRGHSSDQPVGTVRLDKPTKNGITFEAKLPKIEDAGPLKDRVDTAWGEVKLGLVRGVSIGFRPLEYSIMDDGGYRFVESEVVELSLVAIPANAEATIEVIKSIDAELLAASGRTTNGIDRSSAGVTARTATTVVRLKEPKPMKKNIADQISAFEATRQAKSARMDELMDAAADAGTTLDEEQKQEYDTLEREVKEIDEHLTRLRAREKAAIAAATVAKGADAEEAARARAGNGGVRVEVRGGNVPPGIAFTRFVLACARASGNLMQAHEIAKHNKSWMSETPEVETVLRAAVAAGTTSDSTWAAPLVEYQQMTSEFIEYLRPRTIIGRIPGLRRVPFKIKVPRQTAVASVSWVGEGKPKPVSRSAFDSVTLDPYKIAGIIVLTDELVKLSNPAAETLARDDLAAGIIELMDNDFLDPDKAAVPGVSPASLTNGVTPIVASGTAYANLAADVKSVMSLFDAANIDGDGMAVVMKTGLARSLGLMQNSLSQPQFPGLNAEGGTFLGMPVITSTNVPFTEDSPQEGSPIIFISARDILLADEGQVMIDVSREASLQMDSAPDDPVTSSTTLVSLFQHNMVGIRAERMINWTKRRPQAVQYISAAKYA